MIEILHSQGFKYIHTYLIYLSNTNLNHLYQKKKENLLFICKYRSYGNMFIYRDLEHLIIRQLARVDSSRE